MTDGKVAVDLTMSLDGFIAAPNDAPGNGLGDGGDVLHDWFFKTDYGAQYLADAIPGTGAIVMGRRTYDISATPDGWGDRGPLGDTPCFVLTHQPPERAGAIFTFVTDGIGSAIEQARVAAAGKNIGLMGAVTSDQALKAGLVDELNIHIVPILFGGGVRLFDDLGAQHIALETNSVQEKDGVTHLVYRVVK